MNKKKNNGVFYVVISLVAVLGLASFVANAYVSNSVEAPNLVAEGDINIETYNEASQPIEGDLNLGASPAPERYAHHFCENELCAEYNSIAMNSASTTICAIRSPLNATSTLAFAGVQFNEASSTTGYLLHMAKASTAFATTTLIGAEQTIAATVAPTLIASSSPSSSVIFNHGEYFVVDMQATGAASDDSIFNLAGVCKAKFIEL